MPARINPYMTLQKARRNGHKVMLIGAAIQMAIYLFVGISIFVLHYGQIRGLLDPNVGLVQYATSGTNLVLIRTFLLGIVSFIGLSWLLGRWAGQAICHAQKGYAWVGPLTYLLPSIAAAVTIVLFGHFFPHRPYNDVEIGNTSPIYILPMVALSLAFYVPAILNGILSGLVLRQMASKAVDMQLEDQTIENAGDAELVSR
jgi:hypothetical protein